MGLKVIDIVNRALRLIGASTAYDLADGPEALQAFQVLNVLIDRLANDNMFCYTVKTQLFNIVAGRGDYRIGPASIEAPLTDWVTTRPVHIASAYVRDVAAGYPVDFTLQMIPATRYSEFFQKSLQTTYPQYLWYDAQFPQGIVHLWPVPVRALQCNISQWLTIEHFDSLSQEIALPKGYEYFLTYALAYEIAPEYQIDPSRFEKQMLESKADIARTNHQQILSGVDIALQVSPRRSWNIFGGR